METAELETLLALLEDWIAEEKVEFAQRQLTTAFDILTNIYYEKTGRMWSEEGATMTEVEAEEPSGISHHN